MASEDKLTRRQFAGRLSAVAVLAGFTSANSSTKESGQIVKPPRLRKGDTVGLITPASPVFEPSTIQEGVLALEKLGFKVKQAAHLGKKWGYLAGTDKERADDLMALFHDGSIKAIVALRGGYGTMRMVEYLDFEFIRKHPKIILGYSDISFLHLAITKMAGLVTFHGPVAISSFTDYTREYFDKALMYAKAVGEIANAANVIPIKIGQSTQIVSGPLIGGNLTMVTATLGTAYEIETKGKILFLEEVGEEPYDIDRMLTQLRLAGKLQQCAGIVIDRCSKCGPADYKPAFPNTLSVQEVFEDRLADLNIPVLFGLSLGHTANKPTLPLGIRASLDVIKGRLSLDESAVS